MFLQGLYIAFLFVVEVKLEEGFEFKRVEDEKSKPFCDAHDTRERVEGGEGEGERERTECVWGESGGNLGTTYLNFIFFFFAN